MTPREIHRLVTKARESTTVLRDAVRDGAVIEFRQRDPLVMDIHNALDAVLNAQASPLPPSSPEGELKGEAFHLRKAIEGLEEINSDLRQSIERLEGEKAAASQIAKLVGRIYFYGGFKAETPNERELESRLRAAGCRYETEQQLLDDPIASWPEREG